MTDEPVTPRRRTMRLAYRLEPYDREIMRCAEALCRAHPAAFAALIWNCRNDLYEAVKHYRGVIIEASLGGFFSRDDAKQQRIRAVLLCHSRDDAEDLPIFGSPHRWVPLASYFKATPSNDWDECVVPVERAPQEGAPTSGTCRTPLHTCEALEKEIATGSRKGLGDASFLDIDTRVLTWLIEDARALHALHARAP